MDGIDSFDFMGVARPDMREAPRAVGCIYGAVLMAIIVVATLVTILALDYANIHLPADSEQLNWPPLG